MGIAFAEGALGSAVSQQILEEEIVWTRVIVDGAFSSVMEGVLWKVRNPGGVTEGTGDLPRHGDDNFIGPLTKSDNHFIMGDGIGPRKKGVLGAHNLESFDATLSSTGFPLEDLKVGEAVPHPTIKGVYSQKYRLPAYDGRGNVIGYKDIKDPKTVYDPKLISNAQMLEWGNEAMQSGTITGRIIDGTASNGLEFGFLDDKGNVTNFFPVLPGQ